MITWTEWLSLLVPPAHRFHSCDIQSLGKQQRIVNFQYPLVIPALNVQRNEEVCFTLFVNLHMIQSETWPEVELFKVLLNQVWPCGGWPRLAVYHKSELYISFLWQKFKLLKTKLCISKQYRLANCYFQLYLRLLKGLDLTWHKLFLVNSVWLHEGWNWNAIENYQWDGSKVIYSHEFTLPVVRGRLNWSCGEINSYLE